MKNLAINFYRRIPIYIDIPTLTFQHKENNLTKKKKEKKKGK